MTFFGGPQATWNPELDPQPGMMVMFRHPAFKEDRGGEIAAVVGNVCSIRWSWSDDFGKPPVSGITQGVTFVADEAEAAKSPMLRATGVCYPMRLCGLPIYFTENIGSPFVTLDVEAENKARAEFIDELTTAHNSWIASQTDTEPIPESAAQDSGCECPECCKPDCDKAATERRNYEAWQKADEKRRRGIK